MPDDDKRRRRVGDETKERIADLASGWAVESPPKAAPESPEPAKPAPRKKHKTLPPPPPGSAERQALEQAIVETKDTPVPVRAKAPTAPPPLPPAARTKSPTAPPPIPRAKPATTPPKSTTPNPFLAEHQTSVVIDDDSLGAKKLGAQKLNVPVGEFDSGVQTVEDSKSLQIAPGLFKPRGDDATSIDPSPIKGDRAADATQLDAPSGGSFEMPPDAKGSTGGRLRPYAALRRQRGLLGDVRYVFTALFGVRRSRRELVGLEERQKVRQNSRRRHLVTLGRTAVTADAFDHAALAEAREALSNVEDERSKHAGAVAAADAELDRVRRDRETKLQQYNEGVSAVDKELAELAKKLEPLEKEAAGAKKRAAELRESLQKIAKKLESTKAQLVSVKIERMDRAAIQAEIATLEADRQAVQRDEPAIASELDALNPRIAAIDAARIEARKKRKDLDDTEAEDKRRTSELYEAIGAKRKVVERASGEAEAARDRVLFELGERLYVDRPQILGAQLSPIDQIDLELGESDRRVMELREILSNIDRAKVARGAAVIVLVAAAFGGFTAWLVSALS